MALSTAPGSAQKAFPLQRPCASSTLGQLDGQQEAPAPE